MKHAQSGRREWMPQNIRRRLYLITTAALPLLVAYGLISDTHAPLWAALAWATFVAPLAAAHTPKVDTNE